MDDSFLILDNILVLKRSNLFSMVNTSELRAVASVIDVKQYQQDEEIIREHDIGDSMFLIKSGSVLISRKIANHQSMVLAELKVGDCFGEMSAIDEEVRSADVHAKEPCVLLKLCKDDLFEVIHDCPHIGIELLKIFVKRLRCANEKIEKLSQQVEVLKNDKPNMSSTK